MDSKPDIPSLRDRWLAMIPLLLALGVWVFGGVRVSELMDDFVSVRVNPPALLWVAGIGMYLLEQIWPFTIGALVLTYLHLAWGAKTRPRLVCLNIVWLLLLVCMVFIFLGGSQEGLIKIADALRKK